MLVLAFVILSGWCISK